MFCTEPHIDTLQHDDGVPTLADLKQAEKTINDVYAYVFADAGKRLVNEMLCFLGAVDNIEQDNESEG